MIVLSDLVWTMGRARACKVILICTLLGIGLFVLSDRKVNSNVKTRARYHMEQAQGPKKHVLLLGASVGLSWDIPALPQRIGGDRYEFEYVHGSPFDKSRVLNDILGRSENKPDIIILKECAAYFPGDLDQYKALMVRWIGECRDKSVIPIPTTVIPVTSLHAYKLFAHDLMNLRNPLRHGSPFKQNRLMSILAYNDWIRSYCRDHGLVVLDLEAAVRYSGRKRSLRRDLAKMDGLHLKQKAYGLLDEIVWPTLAETERVEVRPEGPFSRNGR